MLVSYCFHVLNASRSEINQNMHNYIYQKLILSLTRKSRGPQCSLRSQVLKILELQARV
jgi:hypothetical protein